MIERESERAAVLGIAGGSAGGKSTLARLLEENSLPGHVAVVQLDRFYLPRDEFDAASINFDHPDAVDLSLAESVVDALRKGQTASLPIYDFASHDRVGYESMTPAPLVVVEGIFTFWHGPLREMLDLRVFVETPSEERLRRRIVRDQALRGRDPESVRRQWQDSVLPMHEQYVEPTKVHAQRVVDGRADLLSTATGLLSEFGGTA